jgi:hypothetical protein
MTSNSLSVGYKILDCPNKSNCIFFGFPNWEIHRYLTVQVKGAAISRTMSKISGGVREQLLVECGKNVAHTVNLFFS